MKDFFISYNQADRSWAEWIAWVLVEAGYSVVIQAWDFRPGSNFVEEMDRGLTEAERVVAVLSPEYVAARYTRSEWGAAFAQDPTGEDRKLIPVRVREVELSGLLKQIVHIDFVGVHDEPATRKLLLDGVQRDSARPEQPPVFPPAAKRTIKQPPRFPGALPSIWNVPHNRNRNFTGRVELLSTLRSQLQAGHHSALTALHGLGGIGKTQTAVEYAYRYAGEYELVWWLRSEDPTTLAGDYALLAAKLGLPEAEADQQAAIQAIKDWLATNRGWLLVFDNAGSPEEIRPYLPTGNAGHVIITSRRPDWRSVADPLSVGTLSPEDAIELLHKRSGQEDEAASRELVEELGWLPLAIEQAAAYIDEHGKPISEYLGLFRKHRQKVLSRGQPSPDYPASVETTWELSFTKVREQSPAGADLLSLCAFLAPDDIPVDVIRAGHAQLPQPLASAVADDLEFDDAVSALRRHSLVERTGDVLSVHRLVQVVVRDRMEKRDRRIWAESAAGVVRKAFPEDGQNVVTWPACLRLFAHATSIAAHCEVEQAGLECAASLLSQSALYLHARADLSGAKTLIERALKINAASFGVDDPRVAVDVHNLGAVFESLGDMKEARVHYERALKVNEASYGPHHPEVATSLNSIGSVLYYVGEMAEARKLLERALKISVAAYGPDHPEVAIRLNNLGGVLQGLGDMEEARKHYERALKIFESSYGPDHPYVAVCVNNLGDMINALGQTAEARKLFERALEIDEAAYGPDHPTVAIRVNNLGLVLKDFGEISEARELFERALKILELSYGPVHPHTQIVRNNLRALGPPTD